MNENVMVTPKIGFYLVTIVDRRWGVQTRCVDKSKRCSCGGTAKRPCRHIRAVTGYLRQGGKRAPETAREQEHPSLQLREKQEDGPLSGNPAPMACPICGTPVEKHDLDFWQCPRDSAHYWQCRAERNGGAIREFLTQPGPSKQGPFYSMSLEERDAFLAQAAQRMHAGGYTPFA